MKNFSRKLSYFFIYTLILNTAVFNTTVFPEISTFELSNTQVESHADKIVWKYRIHNGKRQKRRWNDSTKTWIDPAWIDC